MTVAIDSPSRTPRLGANGWRKRKSSEECKVVYAQGCFAKFSPRGLLAHGLQLGNAAKGLGMAGNGNLASRRWPPCGLKISFEGLGVRRTCEVVYTRKNFKERKRVMFVRRVLNLLTPACIRTDATLAELRMAQAAYGLGFCWMLAPQWMIRRRLAKHP